LPCCEQVHRSFAPLRMTRGFLQLNERHSRVELVGSVLIVPFLDTRFSGHYSYVLLPERLSSLCALPRAFAVI
jgi:hypothetical protein